MPVTEVHKDPDALTMTIVADFTARLERLWDAYVDPRQIEKFWGPPTHPATFSRHDAYPGGLSLYVMTGPADPTRTDDAAALEQEMLTHGGYWEWLDVKHPGGDVASFEVRDGFALEDGTPNTDLPSMRMTFLFEAVDGGSRLTTTTYFHTLEEMQQILDLGAEEGSLQAMGQIDDVLADLSSFAAGVGTSTTTLNDIQVRVSRVIRGSVEQVWRAHRDPDLLRQWMLGPDGWRMVTCEVATEVGQDYRFEWEQEDGTGRFGFVGTLLDFTEPYRSMQSEQMIGMEEGPAIEYETTFTPVAEGTLLAMVMTFPDAEIREQVLGTGMVEGMEFGYQRLESLLG